MNPFCIPRISVRFRDKNQPPSVKSASVYYYDWQNFHKILGNSSKKSELFARVRLEFHPDHGIRVSREKRFTMRVRSVCTALAEADILIEQRQNSLTLTFR